MSIAAIEQHIIDTAKAHFGNALKAVESLPADWDDETFRRILRLAPGLFVVFGGGDRDSSYDNRNVIQGKWGLVAVTAHASGELARRRGDSREIGAYEIIERAVSLFDEHDVPDEGQMEFEGIDNLFSADLEKQGAAIYGARFSLPMSVALDPGTSPSLDAFITFHGDIDAAPADGQIESADTVLLEQ